MVLEAITLEGAVKLATPTATKLFKSKIEPLLDSKIVGYLRSKAARGKLEKTSTKYIANLVGRCSTINTIAFQNSPKKLDELYVPLTLEDGTNENKIKIGKKADIFKNHRHILITDSAGMGKSTLSKRIILNVANQGKFIPVFVELRELEDKPIDRQIADRLGINLKSPAEFLKALPLLYVLDGLDEVPTDIQNSVIKHIISFSTDFSNSNILVTSRQESYLSEFFYFKKFSICRLTTDEAYGLIDKCDPSGEISKKLISDIRESNDKGIKEFLSTPLYVSLLFCSYRHKTVIPQKKHLFYSQVYDALFESHDLSKDAGYVRRKYSGLDSSEFHSILRRLGFWCLRNSGKIEFQKDELEIVLKEIIERISGIDISPSSFVKDIISTVPLFVKEGATIRWSHKSLMEYFASMFICNDTKSKQSELLVHFLNSKEWSGYSNIFDLCADIDFGAFRASVVRDVLVSFIEYADLTQRLISNSRITLQQAHERIALTFSYCSGFRYYSNHIGSFSHESEKIRESNVCLENYSDILMSIFPLPRSPLHGNCYILFTASSGPEKMIINILRKKSPNLFLEKPKKKNTLTERLVNSTIKEGKFYVIDFAPRAIINNSANYELVSNLLWHVSRSALDIEKVKEEVKLIMNNSSNGVEDLLKGVL